MTYQTQYDLSQDPQFAERLSAALTTEAKARGTVDLAALVLRNPAEGARVFMPVIASAPGFDALYASGGQEAITDADMLSAIQANWQLVSDVYFPADVPPGQVA